MENRRINQEFAERVLMNPSTWQENNLDPKKGILLMGNPGVGKTKFMEEFALANSKICWGHPKMPAGLGVMDCEASSIRRGCEKSGLEFVEMFYDHELFLDDLGGEPKGMVNFYGSTFDPIVDILGIRYKVRAIHKTHITTNLTMDMILEIYGERIWDRLHEMCNILILEGSSRRR